MRSLFVYWKMPPALAAQAAAAAHRWQAALCAAHPGLQAGLYQRSSTRPGDAGLATLMETFAIPGRGLAPALDAPLLAAGDAALATLCAAAGIDVPARHVEVFEELRG